MENNYVLFHVEGGLGKNIAATAVSECIKKNYPDRKLIVVSSYPEIFLSLPFVDRVYPLGNSLYLYEDYIKNKETIIFKHEPYFTMDHIYKRKPLIANWCNLYGLSYKGEMPKLIFNYPLVEITKTAWRRDKPIMVLHTNGGPLSGQNLPYSWTRDMPKTLSREIVNEFKEKYHIIQVCRREDNIIEGTEPFFNQVSNMELFSLLLFSEKRVLIDSSLQHAAAALNLPSTVLWIGTSPLVFGYNIHKNIICEIPEHKLPNSYLFDYSFQGNIQECPFINDDIFNKDIVIETIKNT